MKKTWSNIGVAGAGLVAASIVGVLGAQHHGAAPPAAPTSEASTSSPQSAMAATAGNPVTIEEVTKFLPFQAGSAANAGVVPAANNSTVVTIDSTTVESSGGRVGDVAVSQPNIVNVAAAQSSDVAPPATLLNSAAAKSTADSNDPQRSAARVTPSQEVIDVPSATINVGTATINVSSEFKLNYDGKTILTGSNGTVTPN
jgi:hypothetical protein